VTAARTLKPNSIASMRSELENPNTKLDRAIALFKEGKVLARECESLLKSAQTQIDEAMSEPQSARPGKRSKNDELDDQIPF
jgi:exodeoxyribonuclease VII small subunit